MRLRTLATHPVFGAGLRPRRARLAVERFEDRIPIAESVGIGLTLRALAGAAQMRTIQTAAPRITHLNKDGEVAFGSHSVVASAPNGLHDTRSIPC